MALYVTRPRRDEERIGRGLPSVHTRDVSVIDCDRRFGWSQLIVDASNRNRERVDPKIQLILQRV